ncbi:MAG: hypothetical protein HY929_01455 [Euryarchaeota archaeon]|nr:hypothetical protein [Euryarchaeota archaeon]
MRLVLPIFNDSILRQPVSIGKCQIWSKRVKGKNVWLVVEGPHSDVKRFVSELFHQPITANELQQLASLTTVF